MKRACKALFAVLLWAPLAVTAAQTPPDQTVGKPLRIMSVVIVQQEGFLADLLAPFLADHPLEIEYRTGHHNEVARAAARGEADLVITHTKVKALQQLEAQGRLHPRQALFANPVAFLGPVGDPAAISGVRHPVQAFEKIQAAGYCFVLNQHDRMAKLQQQWLASAKLPAPCLIEPGDTAFLKVAAREQAYTIWALHPYARQPIAGLEPIVIAHPSLLESLSGWVVKDSASEKAVQALLAYLASESAQQRLQDFRLSGYPHQQPWWPAR